MPDELLRDIQSLKAQLAKTIESIDGARRCAATGGTTTFRAGARENLTRAMIELQSIETPVAIAELLVSRSFR